MAYASVEGDASQYFNPLTQQTEYGAQADYSLQNRRMIDGRQYLKMPPEAVAIYQQQGLNAIEDPNQPGQYLIDEEKYNALPAVQQAANSNGIGGGALNNLLTYAPLAMGAVVGAGALGAGPLAGGSTLAEAGGLAGGAALPESYWSATAGAAPTSDAVGVAAGSMGSAAPTFGSVAPAGAGTIAGSGAGAATLAELGALPATEWGAGTAAAGLGLTAAQAAQQAGVDSGGSPLSNIVSSGGALDDWLKVGGAIAPGVLGYLGSGSALDRTNELATQARADRQPSLDYYNSLLTPEGISNYWKSPESMGSVDAILRKLSVNGNPAADPGLLSQAAAYNLGGLTNARKAAAGPAFGTANTEANINLAGVNAGSGQYDAVGLGLSRLLNPTPSYEDTMKKYGLTVGGVKYG